ncbi:12834_t:CDS:2, partial [Cetraspora pellucida]
PPHPFTPYIKIIYALNLKTVYTICKWCEQKHSKTYAIENTQCVNKKDRLRPHFQNCLSFKAAVSKDEYEKLMRITESSKLKSKTSSSSFKSKKINSQNIVQQPMQPYLAQEYSLVDISHFEKLVLNATIENGWSFNWVEKESSIAMLKFKNPNLATHDIVGVSLAFDGWKNILKQNILRTVLITSSDEVLIWSVQDISAELDRTTNVISKIEVFLENLKTQQIKVVVGEIFKENVHFNSTIKKVIKLTNYFNNANHFYFIGKLRDEQKMIYKRYIALIHSGDTRWNSFYEAFSCLLCSKASLISLVAKYTSPEDNRLALPNYICETISDSNWWNIISELYTLLAPICLCLNQLQTNTAYLYEVLQSFSYLYKLMDKHSDITFGAKMTEHLEQCWREWEQPLLILSYLLHPNIHLSQFNLPINGITFAEIGIWISYYYCAWFGNPPKKIMAELQDYRDEIFPFTINNWNQFEGDLLKY